MFVVIGFANLFVRVLEKSESIVDIVKNNFYDLLHFRGKCATKNTLSVLYI